MERRRRPGVLVLGAAMNETTAFVLKLAVTVMVAAALSLVMHAARAASPPVHRDCAHAQPSAHAHVETEARHAHDSARCAHDGFAQLCCSALCLLAALLPAGWIEVGAAAAGRHRPAERAPDGFRPDGLMRPPRLA
jgi:hypothetical protein